MKKFAIIIAIVIAIFSVAKCSEQSRPLTPQAVIAPPKPALTADQRSEIVRAATKGMEQSRDKMEKISFFSPQIPASNFFRTDYTYVSVPDSGSPVLRAVFSYSGDSWIFFTHVKIMADNQIVLDREFNYGDVHRDTLSGGVYERLDVFADAEMEAALRAISKSKVVTVRLSGKEHRDDHDFSAKDFANIKSGIAAYDGLAELRG